MNFSFDLPRSNKGLLDETNGDNYFVKQIYNTDEIPAHLRGKFDIVNTFSNQKEWKMRSSFDRFNSNN